MFPYMKGHVVAPEKQCTSDGDLRNDDLLDTRILFIKDYSKNTCDYIYGGDDFDDKDYDYGYHGDKGNNLLMKRYMVKIMVPFMMIV